MHINKTEPLLVLAASARALAECLRRAGLPGADAPLLAVDAFGDDDLRAVVDGWRQLPLGDLQRPARVVAAVEGLLAHAGRASPGGAGVMIGGGFDGAPEVLRALAARFRVLNMSPDAWVAARDPLLFGRLGIAAPETRLEPPDDPRGWLRKCSGGSAGLGVAPAAADAFGACEAALRGQILWQRRISGTPVSLLFCAHAGGVLPVGINRQWCAPSEELPFRFGGVASGLDPGEAARAQLLGAASRLTAALGLRGLCSLDAIIERSGRVLALELNPRPTASVELYDLEAPGLLRLHMAAVCGQRLPGWRPVTGSRALALVYAPRALVAGRRPAAASDWRQGASVGAGEPLCTVHAAGPDADAAMRRARAAAARMVRRVSAGQATAAPLGEGFFYNVSKFSGNPRRNHA